MGASQAVGFIPSAYMSATDESAPVDRTTLQPGRRVSKAGLESLRSSTPMVSSPGGDDDGGEGEGAIDVEGRQKGRPSPSPGPDLERDAVTPGVEGRLGWV